MKENDYEFETLSLPRDHPCGKYRDLGQCVSFADIIDMNKTGSNSPLYHRIYKSLKPDWAFGFLFVVGIVLLILEARDPVEIVAPGWTALAVAASAIMLTIIIALVATAVAALDRRNTDDYHYQIIANGAVIAIITAIFVNMIWLIATPLLGTMSVQIVIGILLLAWAIGYFFYRIRGLNQ